VTAPSQALVRPSARAGDLIVGMADLQLSRTAGETLVTYALGSCLGITIWDPVACVAGMLHVMLPTGSIDAEKAARNPAMFVDTGVPLLFRKSYELGAKKERLVVRVCGGAHSGATEADDAFQIGKRNFLTLRKLLWKNNVLLHAHDVGGCQTSRTMRLDVGSGLITVRTNGKDSNL
jgi:chemotaxis protein CheD